MRLKINLSSLSYAKTPILCFLFIFNNLNLSAQTAQNTNVRFTIVTQAGKAWTEPEKICIQDKETGTNFHITSNHKGIAALVLKPGKEYLLSLEGAPNYYNMVLPKESYSLWDEKIIFERKTGFSLFPNTTEGLINFRYIDLEDKPVANEVFEIKNQRTQKTYTCKTNKYGIGQILVPLGDRYLLSSTYNPHFEELEVRLSEGFHIYEYEVFYQSPSSKQWAAQIAKQEYIATLRDSLFKIAEAYEKSSQLKEEEKLDKYLRFDQSIPIKNLKSFKVRKAIEEKAKCYKDSLLVNPALFVQSQKPILSALNRIKSDCSNKIIVTDVTMSMRPYLEEVLLWHSLNLAKGNFGRYVFFNDGDDKLSNEKIIGSTGGIYSCEGKLEDLGQIIDLMQQAISFRMGGGEAPENDLEAILTAIALQDSTEEIILIADCHSRIRDIELLIHINIPVRVILCGAEEKNLFYFNNNSINEQYLTLAHRTGGSVHTLSKDIWDLSQKENGSIIELSGIRYLLKNRQYIKL